MKLRDIFTPEERELGKLLFVKADTKRLLVIEAEGKKKRVVLNKEREVRMTKAGGYSQSKFRKHVEWMISKTEDWLLGNLKKPGILRSSYNLIKIETRNDKVREILTNFLRPYSQKLLTVNRLARPLSH